MLLPGDYAAIAACLLFGLILALLVLSKSRLLCVLGYTLAALTWAVYVMDAWKDCLWVWLCPHPSSTVLHLVAVWPALIAVLLGLIRHIKRSGDRRALYVLSGILVLYGAYVLGRQLVAPDIAAETYWEGDVMLQTSGSTCVAAASATYLRTLGITLDERSASGRGLISGDGGTMTQAWRILRLSLPSGTTVRIARLGKAGFADGKWRVTSIRIGLFTGHAVAARMQQDGTLELRDPLEGVHSLSWDEFVKTYQGTAVWAEKGISGTSS